jgi:4-hydroxy-4-methyl-2-oxoglutarate aldolase
MTDILTRFGSHQDTLFSAVLADVLDALGHRTSALPIDIRPLKLDWKIFGRAATLSAIAVQAEPEKPYAVELACIDSLKPGDVLIATTSGDRSSALWGELLSTSARAHGARGAVIDGLTRDAAKILSMDFPVFAAGYSPLDSKGRLDAIHFGRTIQVGSCTVDPGDWIFGDIDGVVVIPAGLADPAFSRALGKVSGENRVRIELAKGRGAREVFDEFGIL